ncbi:MAG: hypothetical protein HRU06_18760 [Oceanospirillaceae bacterium]|nr:hypothetical protein [Oceanospirillaceae bacterium]
MSKTEDVIKAAQSAPGYLKFYMSHTAFFLKGGHMIDVPIDGFHKFVFTQVQFIKQGQPDTGFDNSYGDAVIINAGDAMGYEGMSVKKIASIKSRM